MREVAGVHDVDVRVEDDLHRAVTDPSDRAAEVVDDHLVEPDGLHLGADPLDGGVLVARQAGAFDEVGEEPRDLVLDAFRALQVPLVEPHPEQLLGDPAMTPTVWSAAARHHARRGGAYPRSSTTC